MQRWRGRHMTITEHSGGFGGAKGVAGGTHVFINRRDDKRARNNKKKGKTSKIIDHFKSDQNAKRRKQHTTFQKKGKKEKENRTRMIGPSHNNTKANGKKKQT